MPYCKRLGDGSSSSGHWSRQCAAHSFGSDAACLRERLAPQHVASARGGSAARTAVRQSCGSKSSAESSSAGAGSRLHPTRLRGTRRCIAFTAPAVPTRRFDRKYRARVLAHSLHALSSESFKNACFKLRQGNIESKTLDTKNFLKKLPLVVLTATRTRETSDGVIRTYELEYTDRYMHSKRLERCSCSHLYTQTTLVTSHRRAKVPEPNT